ncbi:MAG: hypothetical protein QNK04_09395 [Myxococcota bacterium]|nr:hypothetical protein [Myxococcota bacterium]
MRSLNAIGIGLMALVLVAAGNAQAGGGLKFSSKASGAQEIQPQGGVDTDTSARIDARFSRDLSSVDIELEFFDGGSSPRRTCTARRRG